MCDFNEGPENTYIKTFCNNFDLTNLIKEPTCFKNPKNLSCIDLILSNKPRSIQNCFYIETGLSDFRKMTLSVMSKSFQKYIPRKIKFRDYRHFQNNAFREDLLSELLNLSIEKNTEKRYSKKMKITRLRNKFLKDKTNNKRRYSKQRNYCVSLIRKMKKDYYSTLDV